MTVAVELNFKGGTLEQYDKVVEVMGFRAGGQAPAGALFHWAAKTDDGFRVVDVWQTKEEFERFSQEHIGPDMQRAGVQIEPEVTFTEVHNYLKG
jgi:hypothetical protein